MRCCGPVGRRAAAGRGLEPTSSTRRLGEPEEAWAQALLVAFCALRGARAREAELSSVLLVAGGGLYLASCAHGALRRGQRGSRRPAGG